RARCREKYLAVVRAQEGEERGRAATIELARDVVEEQHRAHLARLADDLDLGRLEREHDRAMLALRRDAAHAVLADREAKIIAVRAHARVSTARVLSSATSELGAKEILVLGCARSVLGAQNEPRRCDAREARHGRVSQPFSRPTARGEDALAVPHDEL